MNIDLTYTFANCFEVDIRIRRHTKKTWNRTKKQMYHSRSILDLQILVLFMVSMIIMWITITIYCDLSHVSIYFFVYVK